MLLICFFKNLLFSPKISFVLANKIDSNEVPYCVAYFLGFYCLSKFF